MASVTQAIRLTLYQPNQAPSELSFEDGPISMGRAADCAIPIKDRFLSRHHAEINRVSDDWYLRDAGSANGTFINGVKVEGSTVLRAGDRIALGDSELVVEGDQSGAATLPTISVDDFEAGASISLSVDLNTEEKDLAKASERLIIINRLALELIEDKPMSELFDFILDRIMHLMEPSRCAIAILGADRRSFQSVKVKQRDAGDSSDLTISRTLLKVVVEERKVLSFTDISDNEALAQAKSIIGQSIRSALCAPLIIQDSVLGVLYYDYLLTQRMITEEDAKLAAQVARVAARKLETTQLREQAQLKRRMEEELETAYVIQSRLLPSKPPKVNGFQFAGSNRPARGVSGDYFDFVVRPDGRIYFIIADVSGKGITAALVMASLATAFSIFTKEDPSPAELVTKLNQTLAPKTSPTKFVTLFAGVLHPSSGRIDYANAGHCPPLWVRAGGVTLLDTTDMVVGLFVQATYRDQHIELEPGDSVIMFTDGIIEAENDDEEELGHAAVADMVVGWHKMEASALREALETEVLKYAGTNPLGDDVTILSVCRLSAD